MIIYISDFDLNGSGYMRIGTRLCDELIKNERGVMALGLGYDGREHPWPFTLVPVRHISHLPAMVRIIQSYGAPIEAVVVGFDVPMQLPLMREIKGLGLPYIGLFPLESPPLSQVWAMTLHQMDARLVMSEFGREALEQGGVDSDFIPIPVDDRNMWRPPTPEERQQMRQGLGIDDDCFVILTVADNQERKNLAGAMEMVADFSKVHSVKREPRKIMWNVVTRVHSPHGWGLEDLAMKHGIMDRLMLYHQGIPNQELWMLFACADVFLLTSKAEGLGIPVMEAMAAGLPVIGTDWAAMREHLSDGRGLLIKRDYGYVDPFGNGERYFPDRADGVAKLEELAAMSFKDRQIMTSKALEYISARTWEDAAAILIEAIDKVKKTYPKENNDGHTSGSKRDEIQDTIQSQPSTENMV